MNEGNYKYRIVEQDKGNIDIKGMSSIIKVFKPEVYDNDNPSKGWKHISYSSFSDYPETMNEAKEIIRIHKRNNGKVIKETIHTNV